MRVAAHPEVPGLRLAELALVAKGPLGAKLAGSLRSPHSNSSREFDRHSPVKERASVAKPPSVRPFRSPSPTAGLSTAAASPLPFPAAGTDTWSSVEPAPILATARKPPHVTAISDRRHQSARGKVPARFSRRCRGRASFTLASSLILSLVSGGGLGVLKLMEDLVESFADTETEPEPKRAKGDVDGAAEARRANRIPGPGPEIQGLGSAL